MSGGHYSLLDEAPTRHLPHKTGLVLGGVLLGAAGWLLAYASAGSPRAAATTRVVSPVAGTSRPGAPGPLAWLPWFAERAGPSAWFLPTNHSIPAQLLTGSQRVGAASVQGAWQPVGAAWPLDSPHADDRLSGEVVSFPPALFQERLEQADSALGYDPQRPTQGLLRRSTVQALLQNGSSLSTVLYYTQPPRPVQARTSGQVLGPWSARHVVLNQANWGEGADSAETVDALQVAAQMRYAMLVLKASFINEAGTAVDYSALRRSPQYQEFLRTVAQLQHLSVPVLGKLDESGRKTFFINLYNALCIHALVEGLLSPVLGSASLGRLRLYAQASYRMGQHVYSLNQIENGLLRGNRPGAAPFSSPALAPDDPRLSLSVSVDPRIHFALNCGAQSCPPIAAYQAEKIDEQLDMATRAFLQSSEVQVLPDQQLVRLSMLFKWYAVDFERDALGQGSVLRWIEQKLPAGDKNAAMERLRGPSGLYAGVRVEYLPYDWGLNSA